MIDDVTVVEKKQLKLNKPQLSFWLNINRNIVSKSTNILGRGSGKSFVIAMLIDYIVRNFARSTWAFQTATFQQALTRTLPETMNALSIIGYTRNVNYFLGRKPPDGYDLPFHTPGKFDNYITFIRPDRNCVGFYMYSQDKDGRSRGPSVDGIITDETLTLDPEKFAREAGATNRGNDNYLPFANKKIHHGIFHFTSMPYGEGAEWLLKDADYYEKGGYDFFGLRDKIIDLQYQFLKSKDKAQRLLIWQDIIQLQKQLKFYPSKSGRLAVEGNAFDNLENVGLRYIIEQMNSMDETMFLIEMLNKRMRKVELPFYPGFARSTHGYKGDWNFDFLQNFEYDFEKLKNLDSRQDKDVVGTLPLDLGFDYGNINWLIVGQHLKSINQYNVLKNFWVNTPKIIDHLIDEFIDYYRFHPNKTCYIYPDAQGNNRYPGSTDTLVQQSIKRLRKAGWNCIIANGHKKNQNHADKYLLIAKMHQQTEPGLYPKVRYNTVNCKELIVSMENAPAKDVGREGMSKDKSSERRLQNSPLRIQATDASDALDQILYGKFKHLLRYAKSGLVWSSGIN